MPRKRWVAKNCIALNKKTWRSEYKKKRRSSSHVSTLTPIFLFFMFLKYDSEAMTDRKSMLQPCNKHTKNGALRGCHRTNGLDKKASINKLKVDLCWFRWWEHFWQLERSACSSFQQHQIISNSLPVDDLLVTPWPETGRTYHCRMWRVSCLNCDHQS